MTASVIIDPQVGEVSEPAPATAAQGLTAGQAWAHYASLQGGHTTEVPGGVTVEMGLLTPPIGPHGPNGAVAYTAYRRLAYGYASHACPKSRNSRVTSLPANPCVYWDFLDADTGRQIDSTFQQ